RLGIGIIYQELDPFPNLTVGENLVIGNLHFREGRLVSPRRIEAFCRPFLDRVGLACGAGEVVAALSIGQKQLVAIARALSMNARILLMDEPTSSLFDDAVERLFGLIGELKRAGVSVVYISHKMDEIFRICDRATVLRDGETIGTVEIAATDASQIIRMMVGRDLQMAARPERRDPGDVVLSVERLTTDKLRGISFELRRGEVLGVAGLVGAGRSELGAALIGMDRIRSGYIRLHASIGLVPEDRRLQGLMMRMSVLENCTIAVLPRMQRLGFIRHQQERRALEPLARRLGLDCDSTARPVNQLSGGNQQKALLARWLLRDPDVLFLDDPTRGIDVGAKQDIYGIVDELAAAGKGVILVSSELPELLRCCHRIMVLSEGRLTAIYDAKEATQENIMAAATTRDRRASPEARF
ncbi:MAG TPA: sugar ABC transporter ATP-binding protein, partial [Candidatus Solibacter sp.]|nr:sugar ABC transporter ATP-binding protein [Candidatus Solibacter sp.]